MSKGIIYIMTSVLPGLIKIGKTGSDQFEKRMDFLEKNGYRNITGLKRKSKADLQNTGTPIILYGRLYTKYETVISEVDTFADEKA